MSTLEEKRVYGEKTTRTIVYVAADLGLARVSVVEDRIGEFSLVGRDPVRSVAATGSHLAVATEGDVLVGPSHDDLSPLDFGPAVAVGLSGTSLLVAGEEGRVARAELAADGSAAGFDVLGALDAGINAVDGDLIATDGGVHRAADGLPHVGLADVNDVAAGTPLAATDDGLYELGNGWMDALEGTFTVASADPGADPRAHAATADALHARTEGGWTDVTPESAGRIADVGYGAGVYAITADGTLFADVGDGWRDRSLGLPGVQELAVSV